MKVLFIYFNPEFRPRTQLSLSLLLTILKNAGHRVKIFDTSFYSEFIDKNEFNQQKAGMVPEVYGIPVKKQECITDLFYEASFFKPELICFTYYSVNKQMQEKLLIPFKKTYKIPVLAGGPEVLINPDECIKESYIDYICVGEGENMITEFCNKLENGQDLSNIKGLWSKDFKNGISDLTDLDTLPIPDWTDYNDFQIYGLYNGKKYRMGHVEFTRGCPFNCTYCGSGSITRMYKDNHINYVRHKKPELAVQEYRYLKNKYNLEMLYFTSGTFNAIPDNTFEKFANLYSWQVNLPFIALIRPELITIKQARLLGLMNCCHVSIGIESGNEKYRSEVLNRKMSNLQIINSVKLLKEQGIDTTTYNMIGLPGMNRKHIFETIRLNKRAKPNRCIISIFIPFKDNCLTQMFIQKGLIENKVYEITQGNTPVCEIADMTSKEIIGLFNTFNLYVKYPVWTWLFIRLLEIDNRFTRYIRKLLLI